MKDRKMWRYLILTSLIYIASCSESMSVDAKESDRAMAAFSDSLRPEICASESAILGDHGVIVVRVFVSGNERRGLTLVERHKKSDIDCQFKIKLTDNSMLDVRQVFSLAENFKKIRKSAVDAAAMPCGVDKVRSSAEVVKHLLAILNKTDAGEGEPQFIEVGGAYRVISTVDLLPGGPIGGAAVIEKYDGVDKLTCLIDIR